MAIHRFLNDLHNLRITFKVTDVFVVLLEGKRSFPQNRKNVAEKNTTKGEA
jgi:hypothetical protein